MADDDRIVVTISAEQCQAMVEIIWKNPLDLLLSESCRKYLAADRWHKSDQHIEVHGQTDKGVMPGTVAHNRRETEQRLFSSSRRTLRLINPLSALEPIYSNAPKLKVLSVGPRTEMEIFHLMAVGFQLKNIAALDLLSSSPLIDVGDMHHMPYDDQSFQVVISSWVIAYSSNPQRAVEEMVRVCADGGIIAIGQTYEPSLGTGVVASTPGATTITGSNYKSVEELKALVGHKLDYVYFQQGIDREDRPGPVMLIARIRRR